MLAFRCGLEAALHSTLMPAEPRVMRCVGGDVERRDEQ